MNNYQSVNFRLVKNGIPTAIIYTRVSTKEQITNTSLDSQEEACIKYAEKNGWKVLRIFREEGESAKTTDRTELQEIFRYLAKNKGKVGKMIVFKLNRFARNVEDHFAVKVILRRYGVELRSATESITNDASGELMEIVLAGVSQFDNRIRAENTKIGMRSRLLEGLWCGVAPYGYRNTVDKIGNKIIAIDIEKAEVIKMIFEKYSTGKYTFRELASLVSKMGMKSRHGRKLSKQLVATIIVNPIYFGMIVVPKFDISVRGLHEPIIGEKLFKQAQDVKNGIIGRKLPRNKDNKDYPLRGMICEGCGKGISGGKTKGKTQYYQYYGCVYQDCPKRTSIKKVDMENQFTKLLSDLTPNEVFFDGLKEAMKLAHKTELDSVTTLEKKLNSRIIELKDKKDKLLELRVEGKIRDEDFMPANEKYKLQIITLEAEINGLSAPELGLDRIIESGIEFMRHLPETWTKLHVKDLRVLKPLLFPSNLIYTYPAIKTPEVCCIYNIKSELLTQKTGLVPPVGIEPTIAA
jgi:site-specific DNA recombinase